MELILEHSYKNRHVSTQKLTPDSPTVVLGSHQKADIHLLGEGIAGIHAMIEYRDGHWIVCDLNSPTGTWHQKQPILNLDINNEVTIQIGHHVFKATPKRERRKLFDRTSGKPEVSAGGEVYHQIIIKKHGVILASELINHDQTYTLKLGDKDVPVQPPSHKGWETKEYGSVTILHRIVTSEKMEISTKEKVASFFDPSLKAPLAVSAALFMLVMSLILLFPQRPDDEAPVLQPQNKYTKIIYDAKVTRKKRARSKSQTRSMAASRAATAPSKAKSLSQRFAKSKSKSPVTVANRLKASGLNSLIGKISKRAAKSAKFIQRQGKTPDDAMTGRAIASVGSMKGGGKPNGVKFKLSGVETKGKAGGNKAYKSFGGLAAGGIGASSVGILEEETEIQGGLDRDVIARVIRSQLGQIRYCYERQLSANPELYGKVLVKFTINGAGQVAMKSIGKTTLKNAMVEGCILRRVASWNFPKPEGGTNVRVSYPFLFKSTN